MLNLVLKIRELTCLTREKFAARAATDQDTRWSIIGDAMPELHPQPNAQKEESYR